MSIVLGNVLRKENYINNLGDVENEKKWVYLFQKLFDPDVKKQLLKDVNNLKFELLIN